MANTFFTVIVVMLCCVHGAQCAANDTACKDGSVQYPDGSCIPKEWVCDIELDCSDGSDEFDCICYENEFRCPEGSCLRNESLCDGTVDCVDGFDETNCPGSVTDCLAGVNGTNCPCRDELYQCPEGRCLFQSWVCDGVDDCEGGFEELNCTDTNR